MNDNSRTQLNPDGPVPRHNTRTGYTSMPIGTVLLERYEIKSVLGRGGMGTVYRVHDRLADIDLALKAIPPELSHDRREMEKVRSNFQLVHKLHHPNIANLNTLERDPESGDFYLLLECVEGEDLRAFRMRHHGRQPLDFWFPVLRQIASALDYAHDHGVIHRDIKPSNIFICADGTVKILDFGIASEVRHSMSRVTGEVAEISGTASYMGPEQWQGKAQGPATDQYALAATTYQLIAGKCPFESEHLGVLREAVLNEATPRPDDLNRPMWSALERGLAKEPAARYSSCSGFVRALEQAAAQKAGGSKRAFAWLGTILGGAALLLAAFFAWQHWSPKQIALDDPANDTPTEPATSFTAAPTETTPPIEPPDATAASTVEEPEPPGSEATVVAVTIDEPSVSLDEIETVKEASATAKSEARQADAKTWAPNEWNAAEQKRIEADTAVQLDRLEHAAVSYESAASRYNAAKNQAVVAKQRASETSAAAEQQVELERKKRRLELEARVATLTPKLSAAESSLQGVPGVWAPLEQDWRKAKAALEASDFARASLELDLVESRLETTSPLLAQLADQRSRSDVEKQRLLALAEKAAIAEQAAIAEKEARESAPPRSTASAPAPPPFTPIRPTGTTRFANPPTGPSTFSPPAARPAAPPPQAQPATLALSVRLPAGITGGTSADVLIDGQSKGRMRLPARITGLTAGTHLVELRGLDRFAQTSPSRILLQSGSVVSETIPLVWGPTYLAFDLKPANATIKLVDSNGRQVPMQAGQTRVAPGARYEVNVSAEGFKPQRKTVISSPGQTKRVPVQLERSRSLKFRS